MFYHERRDPAEAEFWRRVLDCDPASLSDPAPTLDEVRAEFAAEKSRRDLVTALTKAGFWNLAQVILAKSKASIGVSATGGAEPAPTGMDPSADQVEPEGDYFRPDGTSARIRACELRSADPLEVGVAPAEVFRLQLHPPAIPSEEPISAFKDNSPTPQGADREIAGALRRTKATMQFPASDSIENRPQEPVTAQLLPGVGASPVLEPTSTPSLLGKGAADPTDQWSQSSQPKRTRRRRPSTPRKGKGKAKLKKLKTIPFAEHEDIETAYLVAHALGYPFNVALDFNPGIDHLDDAARVRFWADLVVNIRSYVASRRDARGKPPSWWQLVLIGARESQRHNHLREHFHTLIDVPDNQELRHLRKHLNAMARKDDRIWCRDIVVRKVDEEEQIDGERIGSALNYLLKAASKETIGKHPWMIYKRSGFIAGKRTRITTNLTDPKVVAATEEQVSMLRRLREEKRSILIARILRSPLPWE